MDPHHPRREADTSGLVNDMATPTRDAENTARMLTHRPRPVAIAGRAALSGVVKDTIAGAPQESSTPDDSMIRESWVSFASTAASRDSAAPSIFSVRASTASASTRYSVRQSSIESPISATSPMYHEYRKSSFPRSPRYFCTFCKEPFETKTEWKLHEFEFHDRREQYVCSSCPAVFPRATLLNEHLRDDHTLVSGTAAPGSVQHSPIRSVWGCGFCAAVILSRADYLEHVGEHYDEEKEQSEWQHTRVIEALLHQPKVSLAWMALVNKEERARGAKLRFHWDPNTTGRSSDAREPQLLQDILEFFATGTKTADEVATMAYSTADIRLEGNVSDLINKLYLRNPEPMSAKPAPDPVRASPKSQPVAETELEDMVSPMSPVPPPLQPAAAPSRSMHPLSAAPDLESIGTGVPPNTFARSGTVPTLFRASTPKRPGPSVPASASATQEVATTGLRAPFKATGLRRIESSRTLALSTDEGLPKSLERQVTSFLPLISSSDAPSDPVQRTAEVHTRYLGPRGESSSAGDRMKALSPPKVITTSSVRPHTSSSTLSTHTGDGSQGFADSTSEVMSDDSVSEPDSWLEVDGIPRATKAWKSSFQRQVDQGMERLWARYNRDWDALITQCVGDRNGDSAQFRESSGRVRKGTSSRHAPSKGLRPGGRLHGQEDEDDDDDDEGYLRPSRSKRGSDSAKRFACPFRKHDPLTYNQRDHEVCAIRSWLTISRLKEHLYRRHYTTHCQRCKQTFNDARELAEHEMSVVGCEVLDIIPPGDITTYQEKQLKSRKHTTRRQSDKEKWDDIYRLLFPNEEIPSPYPEVAEDVKPLSSEAHISLDFQHFLLTAMPNLFTQTAEEHAGRHLRPRDALPMEAIPRIIEDALQKAFRTWEAGGSEVPTREASVASRTFFPDTPTSVPYFPQPTTYQTPQPVATMDDPFSQGHFGNAGFVTDVSRASHADDSGFADGNFFTSAPPVNYNTFAPEQYERGTWDTDLDLMGGGTFESGLGIDGHFQGFRHR